MDEVRWGPHKHFLLFKSRPAVYNAYFTVPHDFNAWSAEPSNYILYVPKPGNENYGRVKKNNWLFTKPVLSPVSSLSSSSSVVGSFWSSSSSSSSISSRRTWFHLHIPRRGLYFATYRGPGGKLLLGKLEIWEKEKKKVTERKENGYIGIINGVKSQKMHLSDFILVVIIILHIKLVFTLVYLPKKNNMTGPVVINRHACVDETTFPWLWLYSVLLLVRVDVEPSKLLVNDITVNHLQAVRIRSCTLYKYIVKRVLLLFVLV